MNTEKKEIFLIDGNSLCYRAFYAIQELRTSKGVPTNAIYGFINIIKKILKEYEPEMMAVVFDSAGPTERHEKFEEYKEHREPMPDDLFQQLDRIKEVVEAYRMPIYELSGYEADDIIATIAEEAIKKGISVTIVTNDKDALQLVDERVRVLSSHTFGDKVYTEKEVVEKFGVVPSKMVDLMALMGDASDNIPGVSGIGKVTASKLVNEFGPLKEIYKNIDKIRSNSVKEKLERGKEEAELSLDLVTLNRKVPIKLDITETRVKEPDSKKLVDLYEEFEFKKLLKEVMTKSVSRDEKGKYNTSPSDKDLSKFFDKIRKKKVVAISITKDPSGCLPEGIALSLQEGESFFAGLEGKHLGQIKEILSDGKVLKVGFDLKSDLICFNNADIAVRGESFDVMIADYCLDPSGAEYELAPLALKYLRYNMLGTSGQTEFNNEGQGTIDFSGKLEVNLSCERADCIMRLYHVLKKELRKKDLDKLFGEVEMPLVEVLANMELEGVEVDTNFLKKEGKVLEEKLKELSKKIFELAGEEFNINSPKQLQVILFDKLGLAPLKKTKTGFSTDESVLEKLSKVHDLPRSLLEFRELNKLKTGYYDSITALADKDTKKIHANFNQAVTATGRISSSEPNLQNIPIKTELGRKIRKAFIPSNKNNVLLACDYSQVELRIIAHLSKDNRLIEAFKSGADVHNFTAREIFGCDLDDVTSDMRAAAKTVNFGIMYGMSSFGLAKDLDISVVEAQEFIEAYFDRYRGVKSFMDRTIADAKKKGYVTTILNRRRYIPEIKNPNERVKSFAERIAINTPVQGSAADLIKIAMIECFNKFKDTEVKMIIQVHDELVFDLPKSKLQETASEVKHIMENVLKLEVPLVVDVEAGTNWMEMEEVKA